MTASLPYFNGLFKPSLKPNPRKFLQIKAQNFGDEGRLSNNNSNNIVDANMRVLRGRMEEIQIKERLEKCCRCDRYGWSYASGYDYKLKRNKDLRQFFQLFGLIGGTIGFTCLSATIFLCLLSLFL